MVHDAQIAKQTAEVSGVGSMPAHVWPMLAVLVATGSLSQFFRTSNAVIAPELMRDLGLSPQMLGAANSAFFIALLVLQIPLGVLFDRIGVRRSVAALSIVMAAGAQLHALADSGVMLVVARFLVGLGCAGSFMASVVLVPRWFPPEAWSTRLGFVFAAAQVGYFLAGSPLAYVAETVGWRRAFVWLAVVSLIVGASALRFIRDYPPGSATPAIAAQGPGTLAGLKAVLSAPGMLKIFALFGVAYACVVTVVGLWIGPFLRDVHGLGALERGHVLTAVALVLTIGSLLIGPVDRRLRRPKGLAMACSATVVACLLALAVAPRMPLGFALAVILLMCLVSSYGTLLLAQVRARVPDHLAGRGATTANVAQLTGSALLPIVTGFIPPLFPSTDGGSIDAAAYASMFLLLALVLATGLAVYATLRER
jgi:predicted MFS family arabinose efflux permease